MFTEAMDAAERMQLIASCASHNEVMTFVQSYYTETGANNGYMTSNGCVFGSVFALASQALNGSLFPRNAGSSTSNTNTITATNQQQHQTRRALKYQKWALEMTQTCQNVTKLNQAGALPSEIEITEQCRAEIEDNISWSSLTE